MVINYIYLFLINVMNSNVHGDLHDEIDIKLKLKV